MDLAICYTKKKQLCTTKPDRLGDKTRSRLFVVATVSTITRVPDNQGFPSHRKDAVFGFPPFLLCMVYPLSSFESTSKIPQRAPDEAITRISNFSTVAQSAQMIPKGRGGPLRAPLALGILAFSRNREIWHSSDRLVRMFCWKLV